VAAAAMESMFMITPRFQKGQRTKRRSLAVAAHY